MPSPRRPQRKNAQGFLGVLCELCVQRSYFFTVLRSYRFVSVRLPFENGDVPVLDVTAKLADKVDVVAIVAVMVPPSWPTHAGSAGIPPGPTEIV